MSGKVALFAGDETFDLTLHVSHVPQPDEKVHVHAATSEVEQVRAGTNLPIIIGSGLDPNQVPSLFAVADGAIVGQWLKYDGLWWNAVDPARVARLTTAVEKMRAAA